MSTAVIVDAIKRRLKAQGITYQVLAKKLGLSEPTIKRDLTRGDFTLKRLDEICDILGVTVADLANDESARERRITRFTDAQERALTAAPQLVLLTYLLVNRWSADDIIKAVDLDENAFVRALLALDAIGIVNFRPPRGVQLLTARNFTWRKDGPMHEFFLQRVVPDYFRAPFDGAGDDFLFVAGSLSQASRARLKSSLNRVSAEFEDLARQDARLPVSERHGCAAILSLRDWRFSEFARYRRKSRA
ncbi:MAG: helix-turn-helix transcriptional regulator [Steroidobacteraceae bacterium]|nr:helix-turn-helix transcriptional regulator [Steroidobacteraceae bacterium]